MKMIIIHKIIIFYSLFTLFGRTALYSQSEKVPASPGYVDINKDGINDLFVDANGDGINDVTRHAYPHHFKFSDKDNNKINDLWVDKDGDGVNDLMVNILKSEGIKKESTWVDSDGDGIQDGNVKPEYKVTLSRFILDTNKDKKNDITGIKFESNKIMGYRYGFIDEENSKTIKKFRDKNGDGMHDKFSNRLNTDLKNINKGCRKYDYFIDKDGDGIADGRGFKGMGRGKKNLLRRGKK